MKKIFLTAAITLTAIASQAQIKNADFENWTNLQTHVYETEMVDTHNVADPLHGDITNWVYSFDVGISQTTDAYTGSYAAILHNWYNYAKTTLVYRDTISAYPTQLAGHYKYISDPFSAGTMKVVVLSSVGDTISNTTSYFGLTEDWTSFSTDLTPATNPTNPADSIIITFTNATESCQGNIMTCNLLYIDNLSMTSGTATLAEQDALNFGMFPNPTDGLLTLRLSKAISENSAEIGIFDMAGKQVVNQLIDAQESTLDLTHLEAGSYVVKLITDDGGIAYQSLIVR